MSVPFKVLVDCPFPEINQCEGLSPIEKKYCLCMVNNFEDGDWNYDLFQNYIWDNIAETALSAEERRALGDKPSTSLTRAARNLRITDSEISGGEISEILLYSIMRHFYGALPVVPKIFYKQNKNDFAKGADSVHIVLEDDDQFSLWFGEAKFYNSIEDSRLDEIVTSVKNTLSSEKIKKENSIVVGLKDIENLGIPINVVNSIKTLLNQETSIDEIKPHLHIPILLLHECAITAGTDRFTESYIEMVKVQYADRATSYYEKQIKRCSKDVFMYSEITFHLIIIPVPSKDLVVKKFVERAKSLR